MDGLWRFLIGVGGGLTATFSKILALDATRLSQFLDQGNLNGITDLRVTIMIFGPVLMILGGIVAWATDESNRMKLLAIGCAAPALIAPWTAGQFKEHVADFSFISPAYAQDEGQQLNQKTISRGLNLLFGIDTVQNQKYWVIIGSINSVSEAESFASTVNKTDPTLQTFVGNKMPGNDYFPVIVGGHSPYLSYDDAQKLKDKARSIPIIPQAYLSTYADRVPQPE